MEYRKNKSKFPTGNNYNTYPYPHYNRNNFHYNNTNINNYANKRKFKPFIRKENAWHFTSKELNSNTPSMKDGYTQKDELRQRWKACALIMSLGITMKIPQTTIATACIYLHRFYCRKSLKYYQPYEIAASSLYLASKVSDTQRRLKDLIIVCINKLQKNSKLNIERQKHEFDKWKKTILYHEFDLLETICCDVTVDHPYTHLLNFMEKFNNDTDHSNVVKLAWCFINDSFKTTMCLKYSAQIIAASALYMACKYNGTDLVSKDSQNPWWKVLNINEQELLTATTELADVYIRIIKKNTPMNPANPNFNSSISDTMKGKIQNSLLSPENQINSSSITSTPSPHNL